MEFEKAAKKVEESVLAGNFERVAKQLQRFLAAGVDYVVLDCQLHGWECVEFAKEQMTRFATEVASLL